MEVEKELKQVGEGKIAGAGVVEPYCVKMFHTGRQEEELDMLESSESKGVHDLRSEGD